MARGAQRIASGNVPRRCSSAHERMSSQLQTWASSTWSAWDGDEARALDVSLYQSSLQLCSCIIEWIRYVAAEALELREQKSDCKCCLWGLVPLLRSHLCNINPQNRYRTSEESIFTCPSARPPAGIDRTKCYGSIFSMNHGQSSQQTALPA